MDIIAAHQQGLIEQLETEVEALAGRPCDQGSPMQHTHTDTDTDTGTDPEYYDLGSHRRTVTTSSAEAQRWFDRGLVWSYAFHHEEAVACFERAVRADPDCAMAHWGIAHASGNNYNKKWEDFAPDELREAVIATRRAAEAALAANR